MEKVITLDSFEQFFREHYGSLSVLGAWLTGDRATGEDLAQEVLAITMGRWSSVAEYENPGAFCRRVMVNLAANERRRRGREDGALHRMPALGSPSCASEPPQLEPVWAEVRALPIQQRAAIGLRYLDDLSASGIAEVLGCSEATVRVHLHRAHRRLAERLGSRYEADGVRRGEEAPT